jgi:hypothetical protein
MKSAQKFISNATGNGAPMLVNGALVANAARTLRHEEHIRYDAALLNVATRRRSALSHLQAAGLVRNLGGIGVLVSGYERAGELTGASVSMDARAQGDKDRLTFDTVGVPIPVFHKEWDLNARSLAASRTNGSSLDTSMIEIAGRTVLEEMESHVFNGVPKLQSDGHKLYGYATHPDRNTYALGADWSADTGAGIVDDALAMVNIQIADLFRGPYVLYVGTDYATNLEKDYSAAKGDNTIKQRLEAISQISRVEIADFMDPAAVILVQMTSDVVDLAVAVDLQNIQWAIQPMNTEYMTYAMMAIRVKSEKNGRSGICHAT